MNAAGKDRVWFITGASSGLGRQLAEVVLEWGERAVVTGRDLDSLRDFESRASGHVLAAKLDVREPEQARDAVRATTDAFGRLDVVVNNAGRFLLKPIVDTTDDEWDGLMTTNVRSVFVHCRAALPHLIASDRGAIVNVSSISGVVGLPAQGAYCATKGAIAQITRQLAVEHAADGVRVNAIAPGAVDTSFVDKALGTGPDPQRQEEIAAAHPLGRMASAEEIARIMVFLASPQSSFMTGAVVMADGGFTAQ